MPVYQYLCKDCQHEFELKQGYDASTVTWCPKCCSVAKRKIPVVNHTFGFTLTEKSYERYQPMELERNI